MDFYQEKIILKRNFQVSVFISITRNYSLENFFRIIFFT